MVRVLGNFTEGINNVNVYDMKLLIIVLLITCVFANEVCQCPETCLAKEELGRGTWFLLHSIVRNIEKTDENKLLFY